MAFDWLTKLINPGKYNENLLNRAFYQTYVNNNIITWYNGWEAKDYIEKGYQSNLMIYAIIRKICDKINEADLYVYREKPDRKGRLKYKGLKYSGDATNHSIAGAIRYKELEYDDSSGLAKLINKPNPNQSWKELQNEAAGFYKLNGEIFFYGVGGPGEDSINFGQFEEVYVLPSHLVTIIAGDWRNPVKGYKFITGDQTIEIPANQVRHIKMWNPRWDTNGSQLRGQSPLMAGRKFIKKNDSALEAWVKSNQNEGAKGIISPSVQDPKLWPTPEQRKAIDDRVDERINGNGNANRVVTSAMPMRYDSIGLSPVAMAILEGMNYDDKKLCNLFGVNPVLFEPNATNANLEFAMRQLVTDVCIPFFKILEQELNEFLAAPYNRDGQKLVLDFDTSIYSELRADNDTVMKLAEAGIITPNEAREMISFDRYDDEAADQIYLNAGKIPISEAAMPINIDGKDFDYSDYN